MTIELSRVVSIIEYAQQSARMKASPVASVTSHDLFTLWEQAAQGRIGVLVNPDTKEENDERWLVIQRLQQSNPPSIKSAVLKPWLELSQEPYTAPKLRQVVSGQSLISAGTHRKSNQDGGLTEEQMRLPEVDPKITIDLSEYERSEEVRTEFTYYQSKVWNHWSDHEKSVRETIALYSKLFTLKQQLEEGIVEKAIELTWGVGVSVWDNPDGKVSYPLITRLVELSLDDTTGALEIRPRDAAPRLELDWYASVDNQGVAAVEKAGKEFFQKAMQTFSPFDRGSFEPLLRSAVTNLDANGIYRPDQGSPEDRSVPKPHPNFVCTDTWVLFARPRSTNLFIQDLERFKEQLEANHELPLPQAVSAIVSEPATTNEEVPLPHFRGLSMSGGSDQYTKTADTITKKAKDLFFPKPFNDEQVRIVQLLEVSDGVVVQGPPGTGKTHTIANVISHYLANGKRVLVTSMKDPALAVLRDKLPNDIRPLAISLLSTELDGMKQFEHAINKIASEVQSIDRSATARQIAQLELDIDILHGMIARVDYDITRWAKANLEPIDLDGERIDPQDAAREVIQGEGQYEWLKDKLDTSANYTPKITDEDIIKIREARRILGQDIAYLESILPSHAEFPQSNLLLQVHQDLIQFETLQKKIDGEQIPCLVDYSQQTMDACSAVLADIERLDGKRAEIATAGRSWTETVHNKLVQGECAEVFQMLNALGREFTQVKERQKLFYRHPVDLPIGFETDSELVAAVANLSEGKSPFGMIGAFGKSAQKQMLKQVRVLDKIDLQEAEDWLHVGRFLDHRRHLRQLAIRWNALAHESGMDSLPGTDPEHGLMALSQFQLFELIVDVVLIEKSVTTRAVKLFQFFEPARRVMHDIHATVSLADAFHHHLTKNRLSNVWSIKDQFARVLEGKSGAVVSDLRRFFADILGNSTIEDSLMQAQWAALMAELARVQRLSESLAVVTDVTSRMTINGAPLWAAQCRLPLASAIDPNLPDNWRTAWRLRRLATCLDASDGQHSLKKLADERTQITHQLARAYEEIVSKRTWLRLAENASPSIRAALAAYLTAVQKIGKGTPGAKRAVRYRKDAREAASAANPAVPCWIMPHHRISESLPPELGCFDLVIIDEASQSDLAALPALLRAQKVLVVGDDKQVSPEGVGLEEQKVKNLMSRFLQDQVPIYRPQLSPDRSLYDLFKVVFARSAVMLQEHFRCVPAIIEYSKREFYNHELRPLRIPRNSERIDPPLIDVLIEDGFRNGDINRPEAEFIVQEIHQLVRDEKMAKRSIGVVALLGDKQAMYIWERLTDTLGPELMRQHHIACGDARTFQGKERNIMFLSMVAAINDSGAPLSRDTFAQRFNVAASRAQDRMYLVRSLELDQLSEKDVLRRGLISHFSTPFLQDAKTVADLRTQCESPFELEIYDELTRRGFHVVPQVKVGSYRIDMVVQGSNDERLAIECDGDRYHGFDRWADDMNRQRILERAGWVFWREFASIFIRRRTAVIDGLLDTLKARGIEPLTGNSVPKSVHSEFRRVQAGGALTSKLANAVATPKDSTSTISSKIPEVRNGNAGTVDLKVKRMTLPDQALHAQEKTLTSIDLTLSDTPTGKPRTQGISGPTEKAYSDEVLRAFLATHGLTSEDNRVKKGAFWVHLDDESSKTAQQLAKWGFKYKAGRGWWIK